MHFLGLSCFFVCISCLVFTCAFSFTARARNDFGFFLHKFGPKWPAKARFNPNKKRTAKHSYVMSRLLIFSSWKEQQQNAQNGFPWVLKHVVYTTKHSQQHQLLVLGNVFVVVGGGSYQQKSCFFLVLFRKTNHDKLLETPHVNVHLLANASSPLVWLL